jgi:hypothetical protein
MGNTNGERELGVESGRERELRQDDETEKRDRPSEWERE